ncbi:hypothetical protein FUA23_07960 [Neolewinella aurantiaca]|uniref:MerR family transcriptional regulator n=1 Tax=Neolewinella aurantiaca TaxID=2602767 RepID=A0A5C7FI39_9BACT|nr:chaperone modulator CbpM [Neolewinella aurantiaca]TXF90161.1 hypothetical protein FUA23_07960 [Neolewinella aurantiaca]
MSVSYITIQQFCTFHQCDTLVIEEFLDHGICEADSSNEVVVIPTPQVPRLERALRLYADLGVNAAGIDIILNLLDRLEEERKPSVVEDF